VEANAVHRDKPSHGWVTTLGFLCKPPVQKRRRDGGNDNTGRDRKGVLRNSGRGQGTRSRLRKMHGITSGRCTTARLSRDVALRDNPRFDHSFPFVLMMALESLCAYKSHTALVAQFARERRLDLQVNSHHRQRPLGQATVAESSCTPACMEGVLSQEVPSPRSRRIMDDPECPGCKRTMRLGACPSNRNGETKESKLPSSGNGLARKTMRRFHLFQNSRVHSITRTGS
jgi:hypothetical protein